MSTADKTASPESFRPSASKRRPGSSSSRKKRKASPLTKTAQWRDTEESDHPLSVAEVDDDDGSVPLNNNGFLTWTHAENERLLQWLTVWQEDGLDWDKISASLVDRTTGQTREHWKHCEKEYCDILAKRYGIDADAVQLVPRQWMVRRKENGSRKHYWKIPYRTHNSQDYERGFISRLDPNVDKVELLQVMNQVSKRESEEDYANASLEDDMPIPDGTASSPPRRQRQQSPRTAESPSKVSVSSPSTREQIKAGRYRTIKVEIIEYNDQEGDDAPPVILANEGEAEAHLGDTPTNNDQTSTNATAVGNEAAAFANNVDDATRENSQEGEAEGENEGGVAPETSAPFSFRITGKGIRLQASGPQKRGLNSLPSVIVDDDCQLLSDYGITIMDQYVTCKSPKMNDFLKMDPVQGSTFGLVCRHCMDIDREEGRFNPLSAGNLVSMWKDMENHLETCNELPLEVKEGMFACAHSDEAQTMALPEGSRDIFMERLWQRLEPLEAPEEEPAKLAQDELDEQKELRDGESDSEASRLGTHGQNENMVVLTENDKSKLQDSLCRIMENVGACWAEEKDVQCNADLSVKVGFPGLLCNFCKGVGRKREGRFFFLTKESLPEAESLFRNHFKVCKKTPVKVKREITAALKKDEGNTASVVRKRNNYYGRLWANLETMRIFDEEDSEVDESESEGGGDSSENANDNSSHSQTDDEISESQTPHVTQDSSDRSTSSEEEEGSEDEDSKSEQNVSDEGTEDGSKDSQPQVSTRRNAQSKKAVATQEKADNRNKNTSKRTRGRPRRQAVEPVEVQKPVKSTRGRGRKRQVGRQASGGRGNEEAVSSEEDAEQKDSGVSQQKKKAGSNMAELDYPESEQEEGEQKQNRKSPRSKRSPKSPDDLHPSRRSKRIRKRRERPLMVALVAQKWKKKAKRS